MIKNRPMAVIFDLGGVLLNIDHTRVAAAFYALGVAKFERQFSFTSQDQTIDLFERGEISIPEFRSRIKAQHEFTCSDTEFDQAWNSILSDLPVRRLTALEKLSKQVPLYLLSNTNALHLIAIRELIGRVYSLEKWSSLFQRCYYSNEMGMRKPEARIYRQVLAENGLMAEDTIFIDDSLPNTEAAQALQIIAVHLPHGNEFYDLPELL